MATKPSVQLDWILNDDAGKMTIVSAPNQLLGHISDTAADPKIFNWVWNRVSHWITFLDETFDSNGKDINAAKSTSITETISPAASTVTLDAGGIKSWDASSNAIFSVTEPGVVTMGYNGNDIISLTAGVLSVATATAADLIKLHALTPSAADLNHLLGANGNGLVAADVTKLADMTPSAADLNILLGASGNGLIVADITKLANIDASDAEIDQLDGNTVGGSSAGDIVTIDAEQELTTKTLTSPKINEDVVLTATSTEIDAAVAGLSAGISSYNITSDIGVTDKPGLIKWDRAGINMSDPRNPSVSLFNLKSRNRSAGTADGTSSDKLVDNGADFVTDGVAIGDFVYNTTDNTSALVTGVDDLHNLSIDTDIFVSGESYVIMSLHTGDMHMGSTTKYISYDSTAEVMTAAGSFIGQGALKTDTEEESAEVGQSAVYTTYTFASVGEYGFFPQIKGDGTVTGINAHIMVDDDPSSYATTVYVNHTGGGDGTVYAQIRYVTASGEICWLFILQDKITQKYIRMHKSPDHPAISRHDVEAVHHPFGKVYNPGKYNMFCIPLTKDERAEVEDMREWKNEFPQLTFLEAVKKHYDIDENPPNVKWPDIPVTIGLKRNGKVMKAKIPKRGYIKQAKLVKKV